MDDIDLERRFVNLLGEFGPLCGGTGFAKDFRSLKNLDENYLTNLTYPIFFSDEYRIKPVPQVMSCIPPRPE